MMENTWAARGNDGQIGVRMTATGHDQDCDGYCGWSRTLCDAKWLAFLQRLAEDTAEE